MKSSTMRRNRRLISLASAFALALGAPAPCAADAPFAIEASDLVRYAFSAFTSRFPGVSPQDLDLATPVYFHCHTWTRVEGVSAFEEARFECTAVINLDLSNVQVERIYENPEGKCVTGVPATVAMITMHEAGRSRVHLVPDSESEGRVTDCDDEMIAAMAAEHEGIPGHGKSFSVDASALLEWSLQAAIETYPDIPPGRIVYEGGQSMSASCESAPRVNGLSPTDRKLGPCKASVVLADETVIVEYRYIEEASCLVGKSTDAIVVQVDQDGRTEVERKKNLGGGRAHGVECDDAFFSSPLPLITSPR
jgi:hypothetical protein